VSSSPVAQPGGATTCKICPVTGPTSGNGSPPPPVGTPGR
jgi:hypothetical protein